jgi:hypothetical protein
MADWTNPFSWLSRLSRRQLSDWRRLLETTGLSTGARLATRALGEQPPADAEFRGWQVGVLERALSRMCHYDGRDLPAPTDNDAVEATLSFAGTLPHGRRRQLSDLLCVLEALPLVVAPAGERRRFTNLSDRAADDFLHTLSDAAIPQARAIFNALKSICMMGYWTRSETWDAIDYELP